MQNDAQKRNFKQKKHRCWVFLRHCLAWFRTLSYFYWPAAEPLADAQGFRGTPVENHCHMVYLSTESPIQVVSNWWRPDWESNPRPCDRKSDTVPLHNQATRVQVMRVQVWVLINQNLRQLTGPRVNYCICIIAKMQTHQRHTYSMASISCWGSTGGG